MSRQPGSQPEDTENINQEHVSSPAPRVRQARFGVFSSIQSIGVYAFLFASLFTLFTPNNLFSGQMLERVFQAWQANPTNVAPIVEEVLPSSAPRIGIISGHWKNNEDPGAVCSDGLTEVEVNLRIATLVKEKLAKQGIKVNLLEELDNNLTGYKGAVLLSIHSDTCDWISDSATGFKIAASLNNESSEKSTRLVSCLADRYQGSTGLAFLPNSNSNDMIYYHAFDKVSPETTAAIIEIGFLNLDKEKLTQQPDLIAQGIVDGLICFINNENVNQPVQTP